MTNITTFPYEIDNIPLIIDSFSVNKVFNNMARIFRSKKDETFEDLDIQVNYFFSIRHVKHNSALNADVIKALKT